MTATKRGEVGRTLRVMGLRGMRGLSAARGPGFLCGVTAVLALAIGGGRAGAQLAHIVSSTIDFGSVNVGGTPATQVVTLTTMAGSTVTITNSVVTTDGAPDLDYKITANTCAGVSVGPATCNVTINFVPTQRGLQRGALTVNQAGGGSTVVFLRGVGLGSQLVFSPDTALATSTVTPLQPVFYSPGASVFDGAGNLYFNDFLNSRIIEQSAAGTLITLATVQGNIKQSLTINGEGRLYITSPSLGTVSTLLPGGAVTPLTLTGATLGQPSGIAVDAGGNVYIADAQRNVIVRANADGTNATVLALTGLTAPLSGPEGLALDATGTTLYIVDSGRARVVKVALASLVATPVTITGGLPFNPYGLAVDASGTLYIADSGNRRIFRVLPSGAAAAILTPSYSFSVPTGITVAANGDLIVADNNNGLVRIQRASPTTTLTFATATPVGTLDAADGTKFITVQNTGNLPLQLSAVTAPATNPSTTNASFAVATNGTCPVVNATTTSTAAQIAPGIVCTYGVTFTPVTGGVNTGNLVIASQPTGSGGVNSNVPLMGTGQTMADALVLTGPATATAGSPVTLTLTANLAGAVATGYRGTVTLSSNAPGASFPSGTTYTFTTADAGVHTFAPGIAFPQAGLFSVTATDGTLSSTLVVNVTGLAVTPAITLSSSANPVLVGGSTTLTATVTGPVAGATPPAGTVCSLTAARRLGRARW